jgi:hypothetical protein
MGEAGQDEKSISTVEYRKIVDTMYPAELHIPGILYTILSA